MPSFTKLAISSLAILGYSANAAPVIAERGTVGAKTDLKVFADAFLKVTTGGQSQTCDSVNLGLATGLTANLKATAFSNLAVAKCVASYSDVVACTEFGAYLAASYYAYISGWTGATLFAALETTRIDRWHALLNGFCSAHGAPSGVCDVWASEWHTFESAYLAVDAKVKADAKVKLQLAGLTTLIDTTAVLKIGVDGVVKVGTALRAEAEAAVHAAATAQADAHGKAGAVITRDLSSTLNGHADALLGVVTKTSGGSQKHGHGLGGAVFGGVVADVAAALDVDAIVHRDLLDVAEVVGGVAGEGKGKGFLGLSGDKLDLGLAGAGKGKGFLGGVIA